MSTPLNTKKQKEDIVSLIAHHRGEIKRVDLNDLIVLPFKTHRYDFYVISVPLFALKWEKQHRSTNVLCHFKVELNPLNEKKTMIKGESESSPTRSSGYNAILRKKGVGLMPSRRIIVVSLTPINKQ